jgi:hypothetical protein
MPSVPPRFRFEGKIRSINPYHPLRPTEKNKRGLLFCRPSILPVFPKDRKGFSKAVQKSYARFESNGGRRFGRFGEELPGKKGGQG